MGSKNLLVSDTDFECISNFGLTTIAIVCPKAVPKYLFSLSLTPASMSDLIVKSKVCLLRVPSAIISGYILESVPGCSFLSVLHSLA